MLREGYAKMPWSIEGNIEGGTLGCRNRNLK